LNFKMHSLFGPASVHRASRGCVPAALIFNGVRRSHIAGRAGRSHPENESTLARNPVQERPVATAGMWWANVGSGSWLCKNAETRNGDRMDISEIKFWCAKSRPRMQHRSIEEKLFLSLLGFLRFHTA
jgi:hypothetical protein